MDRLVYTALSALRRAEFAQTVAANNLANTSTPGFQRDIASGEARWIGPEVEDPTRVQASEQIASAALVPGPVARTGNPLDVALGQGALLAVEAPGGGEAYTRRGDLTVRADGRLATGDGRAVIGDSGPISIPPGSALAIAPDGAISATAPGGGVVAVGRLKLVRFDPVTMRKAADGLFRKLDGSPAPADTAAGITSGALEGSNATAVATLVDLIAQQRRFEVATRLVTTARDLDGAGAGLMRVE